MKEAFSQYLAENPDVKAIFVGTRRTDPHGGKLSSEGFDVTDRGWPVFMRVHPVIDWHYAEVWAVRLTISPKSNISIPEFVIGLSSLVQMDVLTGVFGVATVLETSANPLL